MYIDVKELSHYLNIKPSTLYAWVHQGKIPHLKIHGLIRFQKEDIDRWTESFRRERIEKPFRMPKAQGKIAIDILIDRAKREVYNFHHGETRPISSPKKGG